jgi:hypothetical protein
LGVQHTNPQGPLPTAKSQSKAALGRWAASCHAGIRID